MNAGTSGPRGGSSPAIESRQSRPLPRARRAVLLRQLAATPDRDALRAELQARGTPDALALLDELETRWAKP